MNPTFKRFFLQNLLLALAIAIIGGILFYSVLKAYYSFWLPIILAVCLLINILTFSIISGSNRKSGNIMILVTKSFAIKFFSYIGLAVVLIVSNDSKASIFPLIIALFILYIVFSAIEVNAFTRLVKEQKQ